MRIKLAFNDTLPAAERRLAWQRIRRMLVLDTATSDRYAQPQGAGIYEIDEPIEYWPTPQDAPSPATARQQHAKRFTLDCALAAGHLMHGEILREDAR